MKRDAPLFAGAVVVLAGAVDAGFGELPNAMHPVARLGGFIGLLERRRPTGDPRRELAWGGAIVAATLALAGGTGWAAARGLRRLPLAARLPLTALALKQAFALRGLAGAGADVRDLLAAGARPGSDMGADTGAEAAADTGAEAAADTGVDSGADTGAEAPIAAARESLKALVSRDRDLDPAQIVSATVESLAENLTDSVTAPLLAYAVAGLPGAYAYRAVNTMDAMIGYRGEYEHVGKIAARLDDVANYLPARLTGGLLCLLAVTKGRGGETWAALRAAHSAADSLNKMWTIAPMAGLLGVRLEKPGHYHAGESERPLTPGIISGAIALTWQAGAVALALAAALAAGLSASVPGLSAPAAGSRRRRSR